MSNKKNNVSVYATDLDGILQLESDSDIREVLVAIRAYIDSTVHVFRSKIAQTAFNCLKPNLDQRKNAHEELSKKMSENAKKKYLKR